MSPAPLSEPDLAAACLRRFQVSQDAFAFREIVQCYGGLVEGTARRLLQGDSEGARDVAQRVFIDLAKAAPGFAPEVRLGGWLHRHTVFTASHHCQAEQRRRRRELEGAQRMETDRLEAEPDNEQAVLVHRALNQLAEEDRVALILRYWENHSLRAVGEALGVGEDAAQKRVSRALDRLRTRLSGTGAAAGTAFLVQCLTGPPAAEAAAVVPWLPAAESAALNPVPVSASGWSGFSLPWKAGLAGAGAAAAACCAVMLPMLQRKDQMLSGSQARHNGFPASAVRQVTAATVGDAPASVILLEERVAQLEARLQARTARERMLEANLKRARERADQDRQSLTADQLTGLESSYQLAKNEPDGDRQREALRQLIEHSGGSNRAGCAALRLARLGSGPEREHWLQEAIRNHSDTWFLDGTSVGAMARLLLAAEWAHAGRHAEAAVLRREIEEQFPGATDHDGLPVLEALRTSIPPD